MGMTIIEKILARKAGLDSVSVGDVVVVEVDMTVLIDLQFATMWIPPIRIHDPDKLAIVMDHAVPAPTIKDAAGGPHARKFAADFGIKRFFDVGRHGICHQVIAENGLARPGEVLACTDSHTCAAGAYNTAARGLGPAEVYSIMCTGTTWYQIAPTIRYELEGVKPVRRLRQGHLPAHRQRIRRRRQPQPRVRRAGSGRHTDARPPHDRHPGSRGVRRLQHVRGGRGAHRVLRRARHRRLRCRPTGFRCHLSRCALDRSRRTAAVRRAAGHRQPQRAAGVANSTGRGSTRRSSAHAPTASSRI